MTQQTSAIFPNTGLASYGEASPEYELAPIGIASMPEQVKRLAEFGRNGDIYVIHAAQGETVIPMEVLDANPQIKALLFNQMQEMGIDPERYIVGNELNSINPVTGMPEFFLSSIFKSVKKVVKKVVKIAKQYAPVILPIAAAAFGIPFLGAAFPAFFGPASIGAAALSSGIGTLIGGGSVKDAFKSALIAGGTTGILQGFEGMKGGKGWAGFKQGFGKAAYNPEYAELVKEQALQKAATKNLAGQALNLDPSATGADVGTTTGDFGDFSFRAPRTPPGVLSFDEAALWDGGGGAPTNVPIVKAPIVEPSIVKPPTPETSPGFWDKAGDIWKRGGRTTEQIASNTAKAEAAYLTKMAAANVAPSEIGLKAAAASAQPSMLAKWGPTVAAGGLAAYGLGAFDVAEEEKITEGDRPDIGGGPILTLAERQALADEQELAESSINPFLFPTTTAQQLLVPTPAGVGFAAQGGAVNYPRREALVEGPGTTTSDDIPAMLSDGEFVINSKAVQGADPSGMGNRYAGAQNLYNMMRNFEMRA
jgi:hypothetical protein